MKENRLNVFASMALAFCFGGMFIFLLIRFSPAHAQAGGSMIAFTTNRDGNAQIYIMNPDGSNQTNISRNQFNETQPVWSPAGNQIAFESDRDGNTEICIMNADGNNQHCLTSNKTIDGHFDKSKPEDHSPSWSPDGSQIAFYSTRNGNPEVFVMNADGSNPHDISNNPAGDYFPAWQPAGGNAVTNSTAVNNGTVTSGLCPTGTVTITPTLRLRPSSTPSKPPSINLSPPPPPIISSATPTPRLIILPSLIARRTNTPEPTVVPK